MTRLVGVEECEPALAEWLEPSLQDTAGRDPLGLNTITLDRILPVLIPGILALSQRARYFSIYPWMLWLYAERRRPATSEGLGNFIRRREYELCLAMKLCPHCNAAGAIGGKRAGPRVTAGDDPFERGYSVEAEKGGFGLNYRTPLHHLGAIALSGTPLGDNGKPIPIDLLLRSERAEALAEAFHSTIEGTEYFKRYERSDEPIPRAVLSELSEQVCLCRLQDRTDERDAIRALLFEPPDKSATDSCEARRRAFALFLSLLDRDAKVGFEDGELWRGVIARFLADPDADSAEGATVASWAALAMKECAQDALCSIWTDFCRSGVRRQGFDGMTRGQVDEMVRFLASGVVELGGARLEVAPDEAAADVQRKAGAAAAGMDWEDLRSEAKRANEGISGLVTLLVLADRVPDLATAHPHWSEVARQRSEHQDGPLQMLSLLRRRLGQGLSVAALLGWITQRFLVGPHEAIAYSKLPEATFRFYWEETGRLKFFTPGTGGLERFDPSDGRRESMASLSKDIGFWEQGGAGPGSLTDDGREFVSEVLG